MGLYSACDLQRKEKPELWGEVHVSKVPGVRIVEYGNVTHLEEKEFNLLLTC